MRPRLGKRKALTAVVVIGSIVIVMLCLALVYRKNLHDYRQGLLVDAALHGQVSRMRLLLAIGATVDEPGCEAFLCPPPIVAAAFNEDPSAVKLLLDSGAKVNGRMKRGQTALMVASYHGYAETVKLLLASGADPNADFEGDTALQWAKQKGHEDVADLLAKAGATR